MRDDSARSPEDVGRPGRSATDDAAFAQREAAADESSLAGSLLETPRGFAALLRHKAEEDAARTRSNRDSGDLNDQIARLGRLNEAGHLSDADFAAAKKKLLGV